MEAMMMNSSPDQSISPYKQIRNPSKSTHRFSSRSSENRAPMNIHGGILCTQPQPLFYSVINPMHQIQQHQQPPLLPLPISNSYNFSPSPINRKTNRSRDQSRTPKKSKSFTTPKKVIFKNDSISSPELQKSKFETVSDRLDLESSFRLGPEPEDLPTDISRVLSSPVAIKDLETFSGSVFTLSSPPPSSLPLPKFSMKPKKLSCNSEAGGVDTGATDNLRRLLRLR